MSEAKLGQLISEPVGRDAVHVAVAPVESAGDLAPGERVGVWYDGAKFLAGAAFTPHLGIVDPFLTAPVKAGQKFYLCLFPGSVVGMRHVWMHPAFQRQA
jgi:hypothetical protein